MTAASVPPVNPDRYVTAGPLARAFNRLVGRLVGMGLDVQGSWVLGVVGRTSGVLRENPVNLLEVDGASAEDLIPSRLPDLEPDAEPSAPTTDQETP